MSRIRRISLVATAAAAALALTVPTSASAISINSTSGDLSFEVAGSLTMFTLSNGPGGNAPDVICYHSDPWGSTWLGRGIADGQASAPFQPRFPSTHPGLGGGCMLQDDDPAGSHAVSVNLQGPFVLTLDGLSPWQNQYYHRYDGRLWLHSYSSLHMRPAKYPGCTITIAGPQSADFNDIAVYDADDSIRLDATGATFTTTKTASRPSTIGDEAMLYQPPGGGWTLQGVTVTP